ncbi:MAG: glycoside hydrolase family 32 protein [Lachnospiraceae bacterium]
MNGYTLERARKYEAEEVLKTPNEKRPLFHFSSPVGWINDPNGFSMFQGECHLFFQYYPYDNNWNIIHWGHAKTKDFVQWENLPAALAPDQLYDSFGVFSGSALEEDGNHILLYTGVSEKELPDGTKEVRQNQCLAIGDGIDYEKSTENPVITSDMLPEGSSLVDFRDPKLWKDKNTYYAVIGSRNEDGSGQIALFSSEDLRKWYFCTILEKCENKYGKMWECADFFQIKEKNVLMVSPQDMAAEGLEFHNGNGTMFLIGSYDRERRVFERVNVHAVDYGLDFYAPQTMEAYDGRRIMVAWMKSWDADICIEGCGWSGMMTFPRDLSLKNGRVIQNPVKEIEKYYTNPLFCKNINMSKEKQLNGFKGRSLDLEIETKEGSQGKLELCLAQNEKYYTSIMYDFEKEVLTFDRTYSGLRRDFNCTRSMAVKNQKGEMKLRILLDRYSVEIFTNDGESAMTSVITTPAEAEGITWFVQGDVVADIKKYDIVR